MPDMPMLTILSHLPSELGWLLGFVALAIVLLALFKRKRPPSYVSREFLFTKSEWLFYQALAAATEHRWLVMGKPRIADVLSVNRNLKKSDWGRAFVKISSKHVDYILLDPDTGAIVACVELDDRSHQRKDRQERDAFVNAAFLEAGIPLLRYPTANAYDPSAIRRDIAKADQARTRELA